MFSGRRAIVFIFAAAVVLVGGGILATYRVGADAVGATRQMEKKLSVLNQLSDFLSTVKDAETGERGYLLMGDTNYLEPYNLALAHLASASQKLQTLAAAGRLPKDKTQRIIDLTTEKLKEVDHTIELRKQGGLPPALLAMEFGPGKLLMDEIRAEIEQSEKAQQSEFDDASDRAQRAITKRTVTFIAVGVINLAFLTWAFRRIIHDISEIAAAREDLSKWNQELEKRVEERTHKLREMVDELQHVSYAITHDMRAPLRAMGAFAGLQLQLNPVEHGPEIQDYSRRIIQAASRLDKLIQETLRYTQAVLKEVPLSPVDLDKLIRELLEIYPNLQPDKADVQIDGHLPAVIGNDALLTQCFGNLLGNAVKFMDEGRRPVVRLTSDITGHMATISIQDNGIGIPEDAQKRLFQMFQRITTDFEGAGVGLAIVKKVVDRMHGSVGVESQPGYGSRFWVRLPIPPSQPTK